LALHHDSEQDFENIVAIARQTPVLETAPPCGCCRDWSEPQPNDGFTIGPDVMKSPVVLEGAEGRRTSSFQVRKPSQNFFDD
jgi:hypothetical protein